MRISGFIIIIALISAISMPVFAQTSSDTGEAVKHSKNKLKVKKDKLKHSDSRIQDELQKEIKNEHNKSMTKQDYKVEIEKNMTEFNAQFDLLDKNHDGIISKNEVSGHDGGDSAAKPAADSAADVDEQPTKPIVKANTAPIIPQNNTPPVTKTIPPITGIAPIGR